LGLALARHGARALICPARNFRLNTAIVFRGTAKALAMKLSWSKYFELLHRTGPAYAVWQRPGTTTVVTAPRYISDEVINVVLSHRRAIGRDEAAQGGIAEH
jgi:hypothetical protein